MTRAASCNRLFAERRRVGAVIGDEAFDLAVADLHALEQPLRHLHRPLGREAELAARLLRQRRRGERRRRPLGAGLRLDRRDLPRQVRLQPVGQASRAAVSSRCRTRWLASAPVDESKSLPDRDAFVADAHQRRRELAAAASQPGLDVPVARSSGTPGALPRARPSGGRPRSARVPRSAPWPPSSTAPATACTRRAGPGCGGSPAP